MSGGFFDYNQYQLDNMADSIDEVLTDQKTGEFYKGLTKETIDKFIETRDELYLLAKKVQRVDWLLSGDDGQESFNSRWEEEGL